MKKTLILLAMVAALMILPFLLTTAASLAARTAKRRARSVVAPDYQPRFQPLYEPASGEIESLLFTLQGSLGGGDFYILGYARGRQRRDDRV
ncbi:cobalt transport protein CbiN [Klebsiella pneumoniae]|uniref:Cobalt transport protein CbiN n=1 Tax=Klebsiella pneumoniae TaxID=573 RepID=A0A939NTN5_KLEPN|nr:cobalt transport protein CbiN [Klebsiella pneumoniae]